ncbi:hypothetical protein IEO21_00967 [Rhodonia placenta]|uniref:Dicer-like protein 1 n=1 Tax=Rhodonia placenta TaxID=104341 RepID=A0A8H7PAF8_9APHY|nr:hypothetical protein IEO21_00967 [Postia placenta]
MDLTENRPVASRSNSNLDPHRAGAVVSGSGTGRVRTAHEVDPTGDDNTRDRPLKRRKTDRVSPPTPLPVRPETPKPFVKLNVRGTIEAVFSSGVSVFAAAPNELCGRLVIGTLVRSIEDVRRSLSRGPSQKKLVLLVAAGANESRQRAKNYATSGDFASVGVFHESTSEQDYTKEWARLANKDLIIIARDPFLSSLRTRSIQVVQLATIVVDDARCLQADIEELGRFYQAVNVVERPHALVVLEAVDIEETDITLVERYKAHMLASACQPIADDHYISSPFFMRRPTQCVKEYTLDRYTSLETTLSRRLWEVDQTKSIPPRLYMQAQEVLAELGPCAAELFWKFALGNKWQVSSSSSSKDTMMDELIQEVVKKWQFREPCPSGQPSNTNMSAKFLVLVGLLTAQPCSASIFRAVILVQRRVIAKMVAEMLSILAQVGTLGKLKPLAVTADEPLVDPQIQESVMEDFKNGTYNLLVITKQFEDMDFPRSQTSDKPYCHIWINFDVLESDLSFAFSFGTCSLQGQIVHMVNKDNADHRRMVSRWQDLDNSMQEWLESTIHTAMKGGTMPPRTLHESLDSCRLDIDGEEDESTPCIRDPTTNATLIKVDALTVIYRLAASMQSDKISYWSRSFFEYRKTEDAGSDSFVQCMVFFPASCPVSAVIGPSAASRTEARRLACFKACETLFEHGVLDDRYFPHNPQPHVLSSTDTFTTQDGSPGRTAVASTGTRSYERKHPKFWKNTSRTTVCRLYPMLVSVGPLKDRFNAPILIFARGPLPTLRMFSIFSDGSTANVHLRRTAPLDLNDEQLGFLHEFTVRACRTITNKPYTCSQESMPYFIAPLAAAFSKVLCDEYESSGIPDVDNYIAWDLVRAAVKDFVVPLLSDARQSLEDFVEDAILQDRKVEFTNRFFAERIRPDLTPLSKAHDSPREEEYPNFLEYCKARIKDFVGLKDEHQSLIEVSPVPNAVNNLNPTVKVIPSSKTPAKYLIPELVFRLTIPASVFRTILLVPSILKRIDDQLLVKELNMLFFRRTIQESALLTALTPPSASVQFDYERLELFGDALLKYVASIYCFVTMPGVRENALHVARQDIISNKALLAGAVRAGLPPYIQSKPFVIKTWQPTPMAAADAVAGATSRTETQVGASIQQNVPGGESSQASKVKRGKKQRQQDEQDTQWLGDKTIADVVEAIIGAAYLSCGIHGTLNAMKRLHVNIPRVEHWSDFAREMATSPSASSESVSARSHENTALETIFGCRIRKPQLLAQALTHASGARGGHGYDRLEFVGDAVLDFLVVRYIYDRHPNLAPGGLTLLKSAMVSNHALAAFCVHSGIYQHIRHASPEVGSAIRTYVHKLHTAREAEYQAAARGNMPPGQYWLGMDPPKILSDVVESIVGTLLISDEFSEEGVAKFFERGLKPFYDQHVRLQSLCPHPTTTLFELLQSHGCQTHRISKEKNQTLVRCTVIVHGVTLAIAEDALSSAAARAVALSALDALDRDPDFMTRTCDCRTVQQSKKAKKVQKEQLGYEESDKVAGR